MTDSPPRRPNVFSTSALDRLGRIRKDAARIAEQLATGDSVVIPVSGGRVPTATGALGDPPAVVTLHLDDLSGNDAPDFWLLGTVGDRTFVAVDIDDADERPELPSDVRWSGLREIGALLEPDDANLLATATGLATWHRTHKYCGSCGAKTNADWGGHRRLCPDCGREHFPRTDPAIIVLVTHDDRALLARNPNWPRGFSSVLAGFVEPGESLEDAVAREVKEEVGLTVTDVRYESSQPWPFPSSIMLGFTAAAADDALDPDPDEIADACFYTADELRHGAVNLPPPLSIARRLIDDWLERHPDA